MRPLRFSREQMLLVAGGLLWLVALAAAPWLEHRGHPAAQVLYSTFSPVCHQLPERSLQLWGHSLAVCHRCTGLYLGFTLGLLAWPALGRFQQGLLTRPRRILWFSLPLLLDVALFADWGWLRFATGLVAAFPLALLSLAAADQLLRRSPVNLRAEASP